ncbi:MAG: type II secretion system secretin GspD [Phycisphaerales bacterium]
MSTQRHPDRNHSRGGRTAGYRVLAALAVWTLAIVTGCQTQPQAAIESPAGTPMPAPRQSEAVRPVSDAPQASPIVAQRISQPPTAPRETSMELTRDSQTRQWLAEKEVITPVDLSLQAPAQQQEPAVQPPLAVVTPAQAMPSLRPGMADEMVSVNFDNVEIQTVLKTIGDITGINFIPHQQVTGTVTVMSPTPIRLGDIYAYLQSILDVHGYATIETENAVKVVPKAEAAKNHLQVRIGADPAGIPKTDVIVTQILPLKYADASDVSQIIQPLLSTGAQMATYPRTNSLMITDTSSNLHHIAQVIQQLDVAGSKERVMLFPLTHASAQVLSEQITRILEKGKSVAAQAGRSQAATATGGPKILPDERTNSIIVIAGEQEAETVRDLIGQLDIERPVGMNNVHVSYLKNADANEVSRSLEQALASMKLTGAADTTQQIQVTPDPSTNALVIVASPQDFEVISQIIEKLDIVREQVLVEMLIMEVTEESLREIGIDWATMDTVVSDSIRGFGMTNLGPRVNFQSGTSEGLNVGAWRANDSGLQIGAILHALQNESGVNILSTPSIVTSNHRTAKLVVGENRPFVTESRITESGETIDPTVIKTFEYKDVGITLEITPHVSQGGLIRLEIDSEFTKLMEDVTNLSGDTPATAKRTAQTVVTMGSGATIVIGGMIRDDTTRAVKKIPLLGDLPLVGALFQNQRDLVQKTNLLLFITPHVMSSQEDLVNMTDRKKDEMAPALEKNK